VKATTSLAPNAEPTVAAHSVAEAAASIAAAMAVRISVAPAAHNAAVPGGSAVAVPDGSAVVAATDAAVAAALGGSAVAAQGAAVVAAVELAASPVEGVPDAGPWAVQDASALPFSQLRSVEPPDASIRGVLSPPERTRAIQRFCPAPADDWPCPRESLAAALRQLDGFLE